MRLCAGGWGCRGKFCDEEMSMCDGTNSFWCEHGGSCEEIVQGEKYSCNCPDGFGGEHCEHSGAPMKQVLLMNFWDLIHLRTVKNT